MLLVDTNVLIDRVQDDPQWADWSIGQLRAQAKIHELVINAVVYAELSVSFPTIELLNRTIATMQLTLRDITTPHSSLPAKPTSSTVAAATADA
jgi:predicted nucleic acid-binding protein